MYDHSSIAPENESGASSDNSCEVLFDNEKDAVICFQRARQKLLDVNHWHEWSGGSSAVFQLTDEKGNKVDRSVQLGDHFWIDIPGPGNVGGKGYDWVQAEAIEDSSTDDREVVAIRVRPSGDPSGTKEDIAHFFTDEASSTFSVIRSGKKVIASVQGRNEKPNIKANTFIDKIRNAVVATGAIGGLNKPQWKSS